MAPESVPVYPSISQIREQVSIVVRFFWYLMLFQFCRDFFCTHLALFIVFAQSIYIFSKFLPLLQSIKEITVPAIATASPKTLLYFICIEHPCNNRKNKCSKVAQFIFYGKTKNFNLIRILYFFIDSMNCSFPFQSFNLWFNI